MVEMEQNITSDRDEWVRELTYKKRKIEAVSHAHLRDIYKRDMAKKTGYPKMESAKDIKSIVAADTDSLMSTLCIAETNKVHFASSSKRNSRGLYSLTSRSLTNSGGPERSESVVYTDFDEIDHDLGVHLPLNDNEELLNDNEVTAESSALASGEWTVDSYIKGKTKELTIDKEFEKYFCGVMLRES